MRKKKPAPPSFKPVSDFGQSHALRHALYWYKQLSADERKQFAQAIRKR